MMREGTGRRQRRQTMGRVKVKKFLMRVWMFKIGMDGFGDWLLWYTPCFWDGALCVMIYQ